MQDGGIPPRAFRRQFVLSPDGWSPAEGWRSLALRRHGVLAFDPDLAVTQRSDEALELTLIGFIIDPGNPDAGDVEILDGLLARVRAADRVPEAVSTFGGRFVLVAIDRQGGILFTDAMGLREVHYARSSGPWCSSQYTHLARALSVAVDARARDEFLNSTYVGEHPEYFWPGDTTPYLEIRHLLPNHWLDLETLESKRFWPREPPAARTLESCVAEGAPLLRGMVAAIHRRLPLALPITAGFDSRTILAAARGFADDLFCYTLRPSTMNDEHRDLVTSAAVLERVGLVHHALHCPRDASTEFWRIYAESVTPAHREAAALAEGLHRRYPGNRLSLSGHGGEVFRCFFYSDGRHPPSVDAGDLARLSQMAGMAFAERAFGEWLADAPMLPGLELLALFYWENRVGRWAANGQAQWDIVHERLSPFNSRSLLACLASAPISTRCAPNYLLNQRLIGALWPELLAVPFNPVPKSSIGARLFELLRRASRMAQTLGRDIPGWIRHGGTDV